MKPVREWKYADYFERGLMVLSDEPPRVSTVEEVLRAYGVTK